MSNILWICQFVLALFFLFGYISVIFYMNTMVTKYKTALKNKLVVITGASSGIGEALAHEFYDEGCRVVLAARRMDELIRVKQDLIAKQPSPGSKEPVVLHLDLNKPEECELFAAEVEETYGPIDVLINNGGITARGSNFGTHLEIHKRVMDVNYFGTVALTNAVLKNMIQRKSGHIGIVASVLGRMALPYRGPYCASKHALIAFADSLRAEVHQHNIQVSVILPGYVKTDISAKALHGSTGKEIGKLEKDAENGFPPEYIAKRLLTMIKSKEKEVTLCQPRVSFALFLRRSFPSVFFYFIGRDASNFTS